MGMEIEHKFLVHPKVDLTGCEAFEAYHGYIKVDQPNVSQIRIVWNVTKGRGRVNIKGNRQNASRLEYEYRIPEDEAKEMIKKFNLPLIHKTRYHKFEGDEEWAIDVYHDANDGLVIAELEIPYEGYEFVKPAWALIDVTDCNRYYNRNLIDKPFIMWKGTEKDLLNNMLGK